jgi:hypothetical protein
MPLSPITTILACERADADLRRLLRQHGQRVARPAPVPRSAQDHLAVLSGADERGCQDAITSADAMGLVIDLGQGRVHLTAKGRRLAASPLLTWGHRCVARGRLTPA